MMKERVKEWGAMDGEEGGRRPTGATSIASGLEIGPLPSKVRSEPTAQTAGAHLP